MSVFRDASSLIWRRFDDWSVLETFRPVSQTICKLTMLGEFHTQDNVLKTFWCPLTENKTRGFSFSARFNTRTMPAVHWGAEDKISHLLETLSHGKPINLIR